MRPLGHASELSTERRAHELASILAAGVLRLHKARRLAGIPARSPQQTVENVAPEHLELSIETVLTVHTS
jgi:hypothetical protein